MPPSAAARHNNNRSDLLPRGTRGHSHPASHTQPVIQSVSQSASQPVSQSIKLLVSQSINQPISSSWSVQQCGVTVSLWPGRRHKIESSDTLHLARNRQVPWISTPSARNDTLRALALVVSIAACPCSHTGTQQLHYSYTAAAHKRHSFARRHACVDRIV
jgi:hypothetical protein